MKDQTTQGTIREIIFKDNFYFGFSFLGFFFFKPTTEPVFTFISVILRSLLFFFSQFHPFT